MTTQEVSEALGTQPAHTAKILAEMEACGVVTRSYGRVSRAWRTTLDEEADGRLSKSQIWRRRAAAYVGGRRAPDEGREDVVRTRDAVVAIDTGATGIAVSRVIAARTDGPRVVLSAHADLPRVAHPGGAFLESLGGRYEPTTQAYVEGMGGRGPGRELDERAAQGLIINVSVVVPLAIGVREDRLILYTLRPAEVAFRRALVRHAERLVLICTEDRIGGAGDPFATLELATLHAQATAGKGVIVVFGGEGGPGLVALQALSTRGLIDLRVVAVVGP